MISRATPDDCDVFILLLLNTLNRLIDTMAIQSTSRSTREVVCNSGSVRHDGRKFFFGYQCRYVSFYRFEIFPKVNFLNFCQQFTFNTVGLNIFRTAQQAAAVFLHGTRMQTGRVEGPSRHTAGHRGSRG